MKNKQIEAANQTIKVQKLEKRKTQDEIRKIRTQIIYNKEEHNLKMSNLRKEKKQFK